MSKHVSKTLQNGAEKKIGKKSGDREHYIIAIGASAGGLDAINELFDNFSSDSNFSFIIIQHLSPDYKSLLVELITKHTNMPVREAADDLEVKAGEVYVIPNTSLLTIEKGFLKLQPKDHSGPNTAIDIFLESLAIDKGKKAIAVILSGTGSDGTRGARSIKNHGGAVIVQNPLSAKFDGMPNSAITAGVADVIIEPELMGEEIYKLILEKPQTTPHGELHINESKLQDILKHVSVVTGHDFTYYKKPTLIRRISRRMFQNDIGSLQEYHRLLLSSRTEVAALAKDFLIGVTRFFRNTEAFDLLERKVVPSIFESKQEHDEIRVWVAACSSGQEAYSIAIIFDEYAKKHNLHNPIRIFASDLDKSAIDHAARGRFPLTIAREMEAERLTNYFTIEGQEYVVKPFLRKMLVFARHNIIKDPPFSKNDLICCRNMLIYMNSTLQKKVLSMIHFGLNKEGYLFLGSSESLNTLASNFKEVDRKWKIYQNMRPSKGSDELHQQLNASALRVVRERSRTEINSEMLEAFNEIVSQEYAMAMFRINKFYEVKETLGDYQHYFRLPSQNLSLNILKLVPEGMAVTLGNTLRRAFLEKTQVSSRGIPVTIQDKTQYIDIIARPNVNEFDAIAATVIFAKSKEPFKHEETVHLTADGSIDPVYVKNLENELEEAQQNLQAAVEELETSNEELQSANEELLSSNEELQSSNEELQSLNEELHTINAEHQAKIKELEELNDDLNNYFRSSHIGQIFLDNELCIRKFNPSVTEKINVRESDIGRPLSHLSNNFLIDDLRDDIERVKKENITVEKEIELKNGAVFQMRIQNYLLRDKIPDGFVITFVDISETKRLNGFIKSVFNSSLNGIIGLKSLRSRGVIRDFEVIAANDMCAQLFPGNKRILEGKKLSEIAAKGEDEGLFTKFLAVAENGKSLHFEVVKRLKTKEQWFEVVAVKLYDGVVATFRDITDKKLADAKINETFSRLRSTEEEMNRLNTELETRLKILTKEIFTAGIRFRMVFNNVTEPMWDWDIINDHLVYNESFHNTFGYKLKSHATRTSNRDFFDKIEKKDRERVKQNLQQALESGTGMWKENFAITKADGETVPVRCRSYVIRSDSGSPARMIAILTPEHKAPKK